MIFGYPPGSFYLKPSRVREGVKLKRLSGHSEEGRFFGGVGGGGVLLFLCQLKSFADMN